MRTVQYVGPHDVVVIASTGQEVEQGRTVEIEDEDLAASLCEQVDNWRPVGFAPPPPPPPQPESSSDGDDDDTDGDDD